MSHCLSNDPQQYRPQEKKRMTRKHKTYQVLMIMLQKFMYILIREFLHQGHRKYTHICHRSIENIQYPSNCSNAGEENLHLQTCRQSIFQTSSVKFFFPVRTATVATETVWNIPCLQVWVFFFIIDYHNRVTAPVML